MRFGPIGFGVKFAADDCGRRRKRRRVERGQGGTEQGITGAEGRVSSCYRISKAQGRPASRRIPSPSGCLPCANYLSAVMTVPHAQQGLHARPQVAELSPIKRQR
jgi:hypothetical protein